jgi:chemotaxis protein MotB
VTLLLALFTTLYAASSAGMGRLTPVSAVPATVVQPPLVERTAPGGSLGTVVAAVPRPDPLGVRLTSALADVVKSGRIAIRTDERGLVVSVTDDAAFGPGSAEVSPAARAVVGRLAAVLADEPNHIRVEGHTDNVPIRTARYASNWELSTARANAIVAYFVEAAGLDPARLSANGYGEFHPRAPNDTADSRGRNRRVDIVILARERAQ